MTITLSAVYIIIASLSVLGGAIALWVKMQNELTRLKQARSKKCKGHFWVCYQEAVIQKRCVLNGRILKRCVNGAFSNDAFSKVAF